MKKKSGLFRNLLSYSVLLINLLCIAWLCACYISSITPPAQIKYIALVSITTPFAVFANIFFVFFWLFTRRKWRFIIPLIVLAVFHNMVFAVFGIHYFSKNKTEKTEASIKVMSWNVHGLGVYDKPQNKKTSQEIIQLIEDESPDILCMPEIYALIGNAMKPYANRILAAGDFKEYRFVFDNSFSDKIYIGTAIFSKYPVHNYRELILSPYVKAVSCDIYLPHEKIMRCFAIHLQSFLLRDKEKHSIEDMSKGNKSIEIKESKSYAKKMNGAYQTRASQVDSLVDIIAQSPYPVMVFGDFNDLPESYTYTKIKGKLADAFTEKGRGLGRTYNQIFPTLRIDYIMYNQDLLSIIGFKTIPTKLSDHNPIIANFELK